MGVYSFHDSDGGWVVVFGLGSVASVQRIPSNHLRRVRSIWSGYQPADGAPNARVDVAGGVPSERSATGVDVGWSGLTCGSCDCGSVPEPGLRVKAKVAAATPPMIGTHAI